MPPVPGQTGNPMWDNAISTLSSAFPDPAKQAEAYYYGSQARKAQLDSNASMTQQAAAARLLQFETNRAGVDQTTQAPGPLMYAPATNILNAPPVLQVPGNLPTMSRVVASGGGGPPAASGVSNAPPTMNPTQLNAAVTNAYTNNTNPPPQPPSAPPVNGAPAAPTTTMTNGQSPPDTTVGPGGTHIGSVTDPNGGPKSAPPAQHNGAPAAPVDLSYLTALSNQAGYSPQQMQMLLGTTIMQMYREGKYDAVSANRQLAGIGITGPTEQDVQSATSIKTTGMNNATTLADRRLAESGATHRTGMTQQPIVDPNHPTQVTYYPLSALQNPAGRAGFNPEAVPNATTNVTTQEGGLFAPTHSSTAFDAQQNQTPLAQPSMSTTVVSETGANQRDFLKPMFVPSPTNPNMGSYMATGDVTGAGPRAAFNPQTAATAAAQMGDVKPYQDPKTGQIVPATAVDAIQRGLVVPSTSIDQGTQARLDAINLQQDPLVKQQMINDFIAQQSGLTTVKAPTDPNKDASQRAFIIEQGLGRAYDVPYSSGPQPMTNTDPSTASPDLNPVLNQLTSDFMQRGPPGVKGNPIAAFNAAHAQLLRQGYMNPTYSRDTGLLDRGSVIQTTQYDKAGNPIGLSPHFKIDIVQPSGPNKGKAYPPGTAPKSIPMDLGLSSTVTPEPVGKALYDAPGMPNGQGVINGKRVIVRDGVAYAPAEGN